MTIRRNVDRLGLFGRRISSGVGNTGSSETLTIPACGIEDVDKALTNAIKSFDFRIVDTQNQQSAQVDTIFAAGERWSLLKKGHPLRDKTGALKLPLIAIARTGIKQSKRDMNGRGINQHTGQINIKRRLSVNDRNFQSLVNRFLLGGVNIANPTNKAFGGSDLTLESADVSGDLSLEPDVRAGGLLAPIRTRNVWEIISIPSPQFYSVQYKIVFWTQYMVHMNQMLENLHANYLPQGSCFRIDTDKGYWFVATVDGESFTSSGNETQQQQDERAVKYEFTINVDAWMLSAGTDGSGVIPIKRTISNPIVSFEVAVDTSGDELEESEPYLGADDPTLPSALKTFRKDLRDIGQRDFFNSESLNTDPALLNRLRGLRKPKYKRVKIAGTDGLNRNANYRIKQENLITGETLFNSSYDLGNLSYESLNRSLSLEYESELNPQTIFDSNLEAFWVGDQNITLTSGKVSTWGDYSGNGWDLTQSNASVRPTGVVTVAALNNKQCVQFGGPASFQHIDGSVASKTNFKFMHDGTTDWYAWIIFYGTATAHASQDYACITTGVPGSGPTGVALLARMNEPTSTQVLHKGNGSSFVSSYGTGTDTVNNPVALSWSLTGTTHRYANNTNDVSVTLSTITPSLADSSFAISVGAREDGGNTFNGYIAEAGIVRGTVATAAQRELMALYVRNRYGIVMANL